MCRLQVILLCGLVRYVLSWQKTFDQQMYQNVLDEKLCYKQLDLIAKHPLRYQFLDASGKIPSGILKGNLNEFGDYHQCLSIDGLVQDMTIQGKYCTILIPLQQDIAIQWSRIPGLKEIRSKVKLAGLDNKTIAIVQNYYKMWKLRMRKMKFANPRKANVSYMASRTFSVMSQQLDVNRLMLGVCVPKSCTARQALTHSMRPLSFLNVTFDEFFCRVTGDKPYVAGDYVAIIILSFILLLTAISTTYDLWQKLYLKRDASEGSKLYRSFSVYTNTSRLLNFSSTPEVLDCIDGIRAISIMWIIAAHTYAFTANGYIHNQKDISKWMTEFSNTWVTAAPIAVDTFLFLTGLLVVYTTISKIPKERFLPSLHLFYLHRILRMFPLLALGVLLSASLLHHVSDGPFWINMAKRTQFCRSYWWSALLYVQNYVNPLEVCMDVSWYLSVDTQLYFFSPLILWWLWGQPRRAWYILATFTLLSLVCSSLISYVYNFSAAIMSYRNQQQLVNYRKVYYINTFTRAPPFLIGMIYGYMLVLYKNQNVRISKRDAFLLWVVSLLVLAFCLVSIYPVLQADHTAQWFDNFFNAYVRAMWAAALGWMVFACAKGYGGPINWFLSLHTWKLPARLSFAMYLVHAPLMLITSGSWGQTHFFSNAETLYRFTADLMLIFAASFVLCVMVDAPFSTLIKIALGGTKNSPQAARMTESRVNTVEDGKVYKTSL